MRVHTRQFYTCAISLPVVILLVNAVTTITAEQIITSSQDTDSYCPTDTAVVYSCEARTAPGIDVSGIRWNIPGEFATAFVGFIRMAAPPSVSDPPVTDAGTGAVACLTLVEDERWVSTLTIANPGSNLDASTVSVTCTDSDGITMRTLSDIGESQLKCMYMHVL